MHTTNILLKSSIALLTCLSLLTNCSERKRQEIVYPLPVPDSISLRFLPGIVSSDELDFNAAFSNNGRTFYFARSARGNWVIMETKQTNGEWSAPQPFLAIDTTFSNADPFIVRDGSMYFISNRPKDENDTTKDYDIWVLRRQANGWSKPENLREVNSDSTEYYVSLASNGNLYFASNRTGSAGETDIYVSRFINGKYETPENLGAAINSPATEHDPLITGDEKLLIFTATDRPGAFGEADLYFSERNADGTWSPARNMGPLVNTITYEYCPNYSPDGKYFFFSSEFDVKWINTKTMLASIRQ